MALNQDREDYHRSRQAHVEQIRVVEARLEGAEARLQAQQELNRECIQALEETERTAMAETARRAQLERENAELRARLANADQQNARPQAKRMGSISSPLIRKIHQHALLDSSNLAASPIMSPGTKRSIINNSSLLNITEDADISNMSSAPEQENLVEI